MRTTLILLGETASWMEQLSFLEICLNLLHVTICGSVITNLKKHNCRFSEDYLNMKAYCVVASQRRHENCFCFSEEQNEITLSGL